MTTPLQLAQQIASDEKALATIVNAIEARKKKAARISHEDRAKAFSAFMSKSLEIMQKNARARYGSEEARVDSSNAS